MAVKTIPSGHKDFRSLSLNEMEKMVGRFEKRVNDAQLENPAQKESVKKALKGQGSGHCPVRLKRLSLDLILRYGDALADLFCRYPDDVIGIMPYDIFVGYQLPNKANPVNVIAAMMQDSHWTDEWGTGWAHARGGVGATTIEHPLKDWSQLDDYLRHQMPDPRQPGRLDSAASVLEQHGSSKYCFGVIHLSLWERMNCIRGMEQCFLDFYEHESQMHRLAEALTDYLLELIRCWSELGADAVFLTDDWGSQNALMISLNMWRTFFKKHYQVIFDETHRLGMDVILHSCGNVMDIIPDLIDLGLDVLDPLQPGAMDLEKVAREFGGKIGFCGAVDIQNLLVQGTTDQVADELRRIIDMLGKPFGNAFMVSPANMMTPDIPFENLQVLFEICHHQ